MDYEKIKRDANRILSDQTCECSYIEYKSSVAQSAKILKTICAYANNYYDNDIQYIFLGVEETNDETSKATPKLPILGIAEGSLEKSRNELNSLRPFLYPNVAFDIIANKYGDRNYLLIVVPRQSGGPFMVSEKAERDKRIGLKAGRYVRIESESRLARVAEEYDLLRKFANYHFSSMTNDDATVDDINVDLMREYLAQTSDREITAGLDKPQIMKLLKLLDKNDPSERKVRNYALLMFCDKPELYIDHSYTEVIVDMFGTKRRMESKTFTGPLWKQYRKIVEYINDKYLSTLVIRDEGKANNRKVANFPYVAVEELVANAIVHNNYENGKPIQIYISNTQINIVNYNRPLPPLKIEDLNERTFFNERDTENPEIRDMFKSLGIIESFGTGIGEAKRAMEANGSPALYYKIFDEISDVTSVVLPVNEEYLEIKGIKRSSSGYPESAAAEAGYGNDGNRENKGPVTGGNAEYKDSDIRKAIMNSAYSHLIKDRLLRISDNLADEVFGNSKVAQMLGCSETTATSYIKKLHDELHIISPVDGMGKGKYIFSQSV